MAEPLNVHSYKMVIKEAHLDTFGHVNNATYLELYEQARWELITQNGYGLETIKKSKKGPVVLEVQLKFIKELGLREEIVITTELLSYEKKISKLRQQIYKKNGELASEALFTAALFDLVERRLIDPTPEWLAAIGR